MINCEDPQVNVFSQRNILNANNSSPQVMQQWMCDANEMHKKAEKRPRNDTRRFFQC